jgi:hypothetical protein
MIALHHWRDNGIHAAWCGMDSVRIGAPRHDWHGGVIANNSRAVSARNKTR